MYIGSGLNTVSSLYGQQKGNQMKTPASGEKTFCTVETPKVYQIFITDDIGLFSSFRNNNIPSFLLIHII